MDENQTNKTSENITVDDYLKKSSNTNPQNQQKTSWLLHLLLFLVGFIGFQTIGFIIQIALIPIFLLFEDIEAVLTDINYVAWSTFIGYMLTFAGLLVVLLTNKTKKPLFTPFKKVSYYFIGVGIGIGLIITSLLYSLLIPNDGNQNQQLVVETVNKYPVLSILFIGIIAPICEELGYRAGLFSLCNKKSRVLAYIVTSVVFGLIHFNISIDPQVMLIELINLPNYIIAGALLSLAYDFFGLPGSIMAHITNNLFGVIEILIVSNIGA